MSKGFLRFNVLICHIGTMPVALTGLLWGESEFLGSPSTACQHTLQRWGLSRREPREGFLEEEVSS